MKRGADWLVAIQNPDGGWGENCDSYKLDYKGYEPAPSTASQTAWALLGLMAAGEVDHPAMARGINYLKATQEARRAVEPAALHRRRLPARVLSELSRLSEILPALGPGALSQSQDRQFAPGGVRAVMQAASSDRLGSGSFDRVGCWHRIDRTNLAVTAGFRHMTVKSIHWLFLEP